MSDNKLMEISFVNGHKHPCGCTARFSDGGGSYSDVVTVILCDKHSSNTNPSEDAKRRGYVRTAGGSWVKIKHE